MRRLQLDKEEKKNDNPEEKNHSIKRLNLLLAIEQVVEMSEKSALSDEFFGKAKRYIAYISKKLTLTPIQSVLFSLFVDRSDRSGIELSDFSSHLKCRNVRLIRHMSDMDTLEKRRLIRCCRNNKSIHYRVPLQVIEALKENKAYQPKEYKNISCSELFTFLDDLFEQRKDEELTYPMLISEIDDLLDANMHLEFSRKIKSYQLSEINKVLLIFFCHLFANNSDDQIGFNDFDDLYACKWTFKVQKKSFSEGTNDLLEKKLIENTHSEGFGDREYFHLSDQTKKDLLSELDIIYKQTESKKGLLLHENLAQKQLYYNEREQRQIDRLAALLQPAHFAGIRQRLTESGMRTGFACLFYGAPGTGKTETVYQLAKQTGRDILPVNVSEIKSMWVGESEKNIKGLFDKYRAFVEKSEVAPILLFNEADAVIGKRQERAERAVDKMENSIQNIILQEMESLDGILIATTNLTQNLDKAFERRFLYKIEFGKPSIEAKRSIWQTMIPALSEEDATELASKYEFSGGQIENIARKHTVHGILFGATDIELRTLKEYCEEELIVKQNIRRKIGFELNTELSDKL
ncbi:MAG: ATP-binding protein [Tannerellaceae bacterium]|jgi:hypothetical protein|nr:ATP-binding protein [Tannerellaceae bacterium]